MYFDDLEQAEVYLQSAKDILRSKGVPLESSSTEYVLKAVEAVISALRNRVLASQVDDPTQQ